MSVVWYRFFFVDWLVWWLRLLLVIGWLGFFWICVV